MLDDLVRFFFKVVIKGGSQIKQNKTKWDQD